MPHPALSNRLRVVLIGAGWTPDRKWDTARARAAHEQRGLSFTEAAELFLRAFGGITVASKGRVLLDTDASRTLHDTPDEALREYEAWVGERLCVVGSAQQGTQLLMISERGALYGGKGEVVISYGTNLAEMLERLCIERNDKPYALN